MQFVFLVQLPQKVLDIVGLLLYNRRRQPRPGFL
jgi:hypothetical protein